MAQTLRDALLRIAGRLESSDIHAVECAEELRDIASRPHGPNGPEWRIGDHNVNVCRVGRGVLIPGIGEIDAKEIKAKLGVALKDGDNLNVATVLSVSQPLPAPPEVQK